MNQKKIKRLRKLARNILVADGKNPDEGKNKYYQENNRHGVEEQLDKDGLPLKDVDGKHLFKHSWQPGTLHTAHKARMVTNALKKMVNERGEDGRKKGTKDLLFDRGRSEKSTR